MTPAEACIALAHIAEPEDDALCHAVERLGPNEAVEAIERGRLPLGAAAILRERLRRFELDAARVDAARIGARIIARGDPQWPTQLDDLGPTRPFALWALGAADLRLALIRSISVVGTREATAYGVEVTRQWCSAFAEAGMTVVSGGAVGIDAAAHRAALACEGLTICVLASGVDIAYPRSHEALIARIADEGLVLSESPLGEAPRRRRFITRNRVIAALSRATLIIEAATRSGTTSTARHAGLVGRPLFAVPGPVTSPTSAGCHDLIAGGTAHLADRASTLVQLVCGAAAAAAAVAAAAAGTATSPASGSVDPQTTLLDALTEVQLRVVDALPARGSLDVSEIAVRAAIPIRETHTALGFLSAQGLVISTEGGWRRAPRA